MTTGVWGTVAFVTLGIPAFTIVAYRLAVPTQAAIDAAAAKRAEEQRQQQPREHAGQRRRRRDTQPADSDAYAEAVNFNLGADNGVVVDAGGEAA